MHDEVTQEGTDTIYQLLAAPLTVTYDVTSLGDTLNDPVKGVRAS